METLLDCFKDGFNLSCLPPFYGSVFYTCRLSLVMVQCFPICILGSSGKPLWWNGLWSPHFFSHRHFWVLKLAQVFWGNSRQPRDQSVFAGAQFSESSLSVQHPACEAVPPTGSVTGTFHLNKRYPPKTFPEVHNTPTPPRPWDSELCIKTNLHKSLQ